MNKLEQAARQALSTDEALMTLEFILRDGIEHGNWPLNKNCEDGLKAITALREALAEQAECKECGAKQAQIDRLMLEYCPDEMTPEQMQEWGNNQRPVEQAEQEPVAIKHLPDPYDERDGVWFDAEGLQRLRELPVGTKLYAAPVRTKDLTDDEIGSIYEKHHALGGCWTDGFAYERAVIAADRELNK